jgi:general secretion pathway protein E
VLQGKPDIIAAFDELVRGAIAVSASDIHMSPTPQGYKLVYRVLGTLHEIITVPAEIGPLLTTRVKVLARLDTYIRGVPQDGRLVMTVDGGLVEARTSTLPTETGERIVLRFVRGALKVPDLDTLGFSPTVVAGLKELLARPQGLLFVTAPVGSGKTTTLYGAMQYIAGSRGSTTSLVTLEDPIELELPCATQTQMHPKAGLTFAATLRSVLRQDPNVLMLGEIRDHETADIAMQAGLTGHLILTTVHGDSAAGPFARVIDMNVEPFIIASATIGCLSQRLVRTLCMNCRKQTVPEPIVIDRFARQGITLPPGPYFEAVGCDYCEGLGYTGRRPIAELLVMDTALRAAVNERRPTKELFDLAVSRGMVPLLQDGLGRALEGETSLTEVLRVAG